MALLVTRNTENAFDAQNFFVSRQRLHTRTGDGRELVVLGGNVLVNIEGTSSAEWLRGEVQIVVGIGPGILPPGMSFQANQWVVVVDPSAMWNEGQSVNSGFAVDTFRLANPNQQGGQTVADIRADVAVRDSGAWLYRISYHVTLLGRFVETSPV